MNQLQNALRRKLHQTHRLLNVKVFDDGPYPALVRHGMTAEQLIREIMRRFDDLSPDVEYALMTSDERALAPDAPLADLPDESELSFGHPPPPPISETHIVRLVAENGRQFEVEKQPTIIGRVKKNQASNERPDIDLAEQPAGNTVSGRHAQISRDRDMYYIDNLTQENRVLVNDVRVTANQRQMIQQGDTLQIGRVALRFVLEPRPEEKHD